MSGGEEGIYMNGTERREEILKVLSESEKPVAGGRLAEEFNVSRQVIVQDIALLRASDYDIMSTRTGYILNRAARCRRIFKVRHSDSEIEDELNLYVDNGGRVEDVFVYHRIYGVIKAEMNIKSRRDVAKYMQDINAGVSAPLKQITSDYHYHTITADSEETLDTIEEELEKRQYLVEPREYEPSEFKREK